MKQTIKILPLFGFLAIKVLYDQTDHSQVLGVNTQSPNKNAIISHINTLKTETAFDVFETTEEAKIPFETKIEKSKELDYGTEEITQKGVDGKRLETYKVTAWQDYEIDKTLIATKIIPPKTEIITQGTKITWKLHETADIGRIKYWHKLEVFATKYDGNCLGCTGRTFSGTLVKKGVCATDPKVIPLGTNFYVEGYGVCRAEDIGGLIKGNRIDLGYEAAAQGNWRTGYTTIYLLTNAPE